VLQYRKKPDEPHLGFFDEDPSKTAEKYTNLKNHKKVALFVFGFSPFVLVIHYEFEKCGNMKREGNQIDINNLRDAFETLRGCAFKDLRSPTKEKLLETLGSDEEMTKILGRNHKKC